MALSEFAPAKVNLYLHVTGRRADGYHLLDSLVVFANVGDHIEWRLADELTLAIEGPEGKTLAAEPDNLVLRAARALADAGCGRITLHKNLPVASGVGGGSSDAAASLRLLARAWNLTRDLEPIAASLGADVPVSLARRPALMQGIGEILGPAPAIPAAGMVLVNPRVPLPTAQVFKARDGKFSPAAALPPGWKDARAMAAGLAQLRNDLEPPAIALCPAVAQVLQTLNALPGLLLARMSGSGATCFGLFETPAAAIAAAGLLPAHWWRWGGGLYAPS